MAFGYCPPRMTGQKCVGFLDRFIGCPLLLLTITHNQYKYVRKPRLQMAPLAYVDAKIENENELEGNVIRRD